MRPTPVEHRTFRCTSESVSCTCAACKRWASSRASLFVAKAPTSARSAALAVPWATLSSRGAHRTFPARHTPLGCLQLCLQRLRGGFVCLCRNTQPSAASQHHSRSGAPGERRGPVNSQARGWQVHDALGPVFVYQVGVRQSAAEVLDGRLAGLCSTLQGFPSGPKLQRLRFHNEKTVERRRQLGLFAGGQSARLLQLGSTQMNRPRQHETASVPASRQGSRSGYHDDVRQS